MTYKTLFWSIGYALPVAVAIAISFQLQREHAALEAMLAKLTASSLQIESALQESTNQWRTLDHEGDLIEARLKKLEPTLSPWQKWEIAVMETGARLAAEGGSKTKGSVDQSSYFPQLLDDPEYHDAVASLAKQQIEGKYGRLFAALNLSPSDQAQLETLLTQKEMATADAKSLILGGSNQASASSPMVEAEINSASLSTVKAIYADIRTTLGVQVAHEVSAYEGIAQFYSATDKMAASLSATSTPLQPAQADQVVGLLAQALGPKVYTSYWEVPNSVIAQAASVLSPPQVDALRQMQQEQAARIQTRNIRLSAANQP